MASTTMAILAAGAIGAAAFAPPPGDTPAPAQQVQPKICEMVVGAEAHAKPYQLCMTAAQWKAKKLADSKDANRIVCHYEQEIGSRFRTAKMCAPASEWASRRMHDREAIEQIQMRVCVSGAGC